jgi:hypothetical protein
MTILCLTRSINLNNRERKSLKPDYDSITRPGGISKTIPTGFIKEFVNKHKLNSSRPVFDDKNIYLSNKAGPVGKATLTAMQTLCSYSYDLLQSLFKITSESGIDYLSKSYSYAFGKD